MHFSWISFICGTSRLDGIDIVSYRVGVSNIRAQGRDDGRHCALVDLSFIIYICTNIIGSDAYPIHPWFAGPVQSHRAYGINRDPGDIGRTLRIC